MATESIFRKAALERLSTPDRLDQGLSIVGRATWLVLAALALLIVGGVIWSLTLSVPVTVRGQGILLAPGGVLDVTSDNPGRLVTFTVNVGDQIKSGSVVARIDQPEVRQELLNAEAELRDAQEEHGQIVDAQQKRAPIFQASIAQRRRALQDNIAFLDRRLKMLTEREEANRSLVEQQLIVVQKLLDSRLELGRALEEKAQAQNGLLNLDVEVSKAEIEDQRERLNSELRVASAERKIRTLRERLDRQSVVVSPYDGVVSELKVNPGEIVERNGALFSLLPSSTPTALPSAPGVSVGPLYAVIYVPPNDGKKVRPGMTVRISPSDVPREQFGFIEGRVRTVADTPSTAEGMNRTLKNRQLAQTLAHDGAPFELIVDLIADPAMPSGYRWSSSRGPDVKINAGTLAGGDVEVQSMPLLSLVIPPLRQILSGTKP